MVFMAKNQILQLEEKKKNPLLLAINLWEVICWRSDLPSTKIILFLKCIYFFIIWT